MKINDWEPKINDLYFLSVFDIKYANKIVQCTKIIDDYNCMMMLIDEDDVENDEYGWVINFHQEPIYSFVFDEEGINKLRSIRLKQILKN